MDQKSLKTSWKQRVVIIIIAFLMVFSFAATYIAIIISNSKSSSSDSETEENPEITAIQEEYEKKQEEINKYTETLSAKYLDTLKSYKSQVKSYNATTANSDGLKTTDLKEGDGRELKADDKEYFAYYIGWCADESIFDSSFDSYESPTALKIPVAAAAGLIEGWNQGVIGMKLNGVRVISIPGELAYGDTREVCGDKNSPLKFVVIPFSDDKMKSLVDDADEILNRLNKVYQESSGN